MVTYSDLLTEVLDDRTLVLLAWIVVTVPLIALFAPNERKRGRVMLLLAALHLLLVVVAGTLRESDKVAWRDVRLPALVFAGMSAVGLGTTVLFSVILPRLRVAAPIILRDLFDAGVTMAVVFTVAARNDIDLHGIIATSAVITAVIGFSLQDTLGNIMGGLALQLDSSVKVGDWIRVGDVTGKVTEIRWRYTAIETRNWETVILPNSTLMKGQVTVLGRRTGRPVQWRRWVWFNVDFRYPPPEVIAAVQNALQGARLDNVASDPAPNCILMDLHESYARYAVRYWLTDLAADDPTDSAVRTRVHFALRRAGIPLSIPAQAVFTTTESHERKELKARQEHERRLRALRQIELFGSLEGEELDRLADALVPAPFAKGEVVTRQDAEAHWLYMIVRGEVSVRIASEGVEREANKLHAGQFFGELSLLTGARRTATLVALSDVECYRLDAAVAHRLLQQRPALAEDFAEMLARRKVALDAARKDLDEAAREKCVAHERDDLLDKIRAFFALDDEELPARDDRTGT